MIKHAPKWFTFFPYREKRCLKGFFWNLVFPNIFHTIPLCSHQVHNGYLLHFPISSPSSQYHRTLSHMFCPKSSSCELYIGSPKEETKLCLLWEWLKFASTLISLGHVKGSIVGVYQSGLFFLGSGPTMKECSKMNKEQNNTFPQNSKWIVIDQTQNLQHKFAMPWFKKVHNLLAKTKLINTNHIN